jgi:hypothetical protein
VPDRLEHPEHVRRLAVGDELRFVRVRGIEVGVDLVPVRARRDHLIEAASVDGRDVFRRTTVSAP